MQHHTIEQREVKMALFFINSVPPEKLVDLLITIASKNVIEHWELVMMGLIRKFINEGR